MMVPAVATTSCLRLDPVTLMSMRVTPSAWSVPAWMHASAECPWYVEQVRVRAASKHDAC